MLSSSRITDFPVCIPGNRAGFSDKLLAEQQKMALKRSRHPISGNFPVPGQKWESRAVAERLRQAVERAGGLQEISRRTGIPDSTLSHNIKIGDLKFSNAAAIAGACNVSLEWLATGHEAIQPRHELHEPQAPSPTVRPASNLFGTLDIDRLARAMEKAFQMFGERGHRPSMRRLAQVVLLLYDDFVDPSQSSSAASGRLVHNEGDSDETG